MVGLLACVREYFSCIVGARNVFILQSVAWYVATKHYTVRNLARGCMVVASNAVTRAIAEQHAQGRSIHSSRMTLCIA